MRKNTFTKRIYKTVNLFLIGAFISLLACNTNKKMDAEFLGKDDGALWIGDGKNQPLEDSLFYVDDPAPIFRKEFTLDNGIKMAKLFITAAGYYKAGINGSRVGSNMLDPAWTDFGKRIYFSEYDITDLIRPGINCIGVTLGNGFYNLLPLRMWGRRNLREVLNTGRPVFMGKMVVEYQNGNQEVIITDQTWKVSSGPIMRNNVYLGEVYDSRNDLKGWEKSGFDDSEWEMAVTGKGPGGILQKAFFPPVRITGIISPVKIYSPKEGIYIADMGVNFAGTYRIRLNGNEGDSVTFRFGERVYPDGSLNPMTTVCGQIKKAGVGGPGSPDIAWQSDTYIIGNNPDSWFQPEFTYHTYRYMEITGLTTKPDISDIEGLVMNTDVPHDNSFSCSSDLLNSIQEAVVRTFQANLISVQSDCPAREKFGYGGDLNATSEAYVYNFEMNSFYRKTVYDWVDAMNDTVFVDTAPYVGIRYCGLSWESAFLITQYYLFLYYNDVDFIKEMYELDKKWMEKAARIHPDGIVDKGLGDHESLERVPVEITGTCHYLFCARIMQKFASVLGDKENERKYGQLAVNLESLIKSKFWDTPVNEQINKQTLYASLLYYNIFPHSETGSVVDSLMKALNNAPAGHFTTGIFGTKYILEALSKFVSPDKVFEIVNSTEYPGWGFMIENGATTIWETWKESDNTYSNCHPMFGSVSEWFFRWLGGISPDPEYPGFEKFRFSPSVPDGLEWVNCNYYCPYGKIVSNWKKTENKLIYQVVIPKGTVAFVDLKKNTSQAIQIEEITGRKFNQDKVKGLQSGKFELGSGEYRITVN